MKRILLSSAPFLFLLICMEFLVQGEIIPSFLLPRPSEILNALTTDSSDLWKAFGNTAWMAAAGFLISALLGISLSLIFSLSKLLESVLLPYATFFQTVPVIAVAPLLVIWLGYGTPTVIASSLIVSLFPIIAGTLGGLKSTEPSLQDLFSLYGANRIQSLFKLKLPFAVPQILIGLRIGSGLSVIGAIVGEFIAGGGLGGIIDVARTRQRVDQVFAAILLASILGFLFLAFISLLSRILLRNWHPSENT